jgi:hypothetical protein
MNIFCIVGAPSRCRDFIDHLSKLSLVVAPRNWYKN